MTDVKSPATRHCNSDEMQAAATAEHQTVAIEASFSGSQMLAAFTTTEGGESAGEFATLNMSFQTGDERRTVAENRRRAAEALGYAPDRLVVARLAHGPHVEVIRAVDAGRGANDYESGIEATDALVTDAYDVPICVLVADCAPVLLFDPVAGAVGVSHAGWRGARDRVVAATVAEMTSEYGTDPADVHVAVGPCISLASFEMGDAEAAECADAFLDVGVVSREFGLKPHVDLRAMLLAQIREAGVSPEHVEVVTDDTMTNNRFYSHRRSMERSGTTGGRFAGVVMLRS